MRDIKSHIAHILWLEGSASVPAIGVFRLTGICATVSGDGLNAPASVILYDQVSDADGKELVNSIMRESGVDFDTAASIVAESCARLYDNLQCGQSVEIEGVGSLVADASTGEVQFTQAISQIGLPSVALTEIVSEKKDDKAVEAATGAFARRREEFARSLQRTASSAAAIAVFVLMAFVVSQLPSRRTTSNVASIVGESLSAPAREAEKPLIVMPGASEPHLVLILNTPADASGPAKQRYRKAELENNEEIGRYCLVVGSLATKDEAELFIRNHTTERHPLRLLAEGGRFRVITLSGSSFSEVAKAGETHGVYDQYPSAWICRR